jgi:hypothetical protein
LEKSGIYFDEEYFYASIREGKWSEVENYLSSFTSWSDNKYSAMMIFEIEKQKFYEALHK